MVDESIEGKIDYEYFDSPSKMKKLKEELALMQKKYTVYTDNLKDFIQRTQEKQLN